LPVLADSTLVARIYHAVPDPSRWGRVVAALAAGVQARSAVLVLHTENHGQRRVFGAGVPVRRLRALERWLAREPRGFDLGRMPDRPGFVAASSRGARDPLAQSSLYRQWMQPQGLVHLLVGSLHSPRDHTCRLALFRGAPEGPFGGREIRLLEQLRLHLARAIEVQEAATFATATKAALVGLVNAHHLGVLVSDPNGRLLFANRKARAILEQRDGLVLERPELRSLEPCEAPRLRRAVADAALGASKEGEALLLSRASGRAPLRVLVSALHASQSLGGRESGAALLFVIDSESLGPSDAESLRTRFGLTHAEARVACRIAQGERPAEIARALEVSIATVRTHLQRVLEKTGTHRQSELVRCLLTGAGPEEATERPHSFE
jgi:DNA-binding CsgD family transcriptional regulator